MIRRYSIGNGWAVTDDENCRATLDEMTEEMVNAGVYDRYVDLTRPDSESNPSTPED